MTRMSCTDVGAHTFRRANHRDLELARHLQFTLVMNNAQMQGMRHIAKWQHTYKVTLVFTREFTSGSLEGKTHTDSLGFCNELDAEEWVSAVNAAAAKGKLDYRVISWRVIS